MGQKLINSRLDPEPPTLQAHVCHLPQFCTRVQLGLLFFTLQAAQVHIFQLNNEESVMGNNIPVSQTCQETVVWELFYCFFCSIFVFSTLGFLRLHIAYINLLQHLLEIYI